MQHLFLLEQGEVLDLDVNYRPGRNGDESEIMIVSAHYHGVDVLPVLQHFNVESDLEETVVMELDERMVAAKMRDINDSGFGL